MLKIFPTAMVACFALAIQVRGEPAVVVSLASVGDRIRAQNPDLAAARLRIQEATGRMHQSGRLTNPELETSLDHDPRFREGKVEIGISQKFPVTDRLRVEKTISLSELKSAEAEVREIERQLTGQARQVVVKILANRQRRDLLGEQSRVSSDFAKFLSDVAAKGEGSILDAGQAKLDAASLALEMRQLGASEAVLVGELKPLLGMGLGEALSVGGTLPAATLPSARIDLARRPDFQAAKLNVDAAVQGVALENAKRYDDVEGGVFAAAERNQDVPAGYENDLMVGVRFKVALPFWSKNEGAIQEAEAKKVRREKEAVALSRNIRLEAEAARAEMSEWVSMIKEIEASLLPLAEEQSAVTQEAFRKGQGDIQSVIRSREKRLQLAVARLDALREFHLARVRHETALAKP